MVRKGMFQVAQVLGRSSDDPELLAALKTNGGCAPCGNAHTIAPCQEAALVRIDGEIEFCCAGRLNSHEVVTVTPALLASILGLPAVGLSPPRRSKLHCRETART